MSKSALDELIGMSKPKKTWHISNKFGHMDFEDNGSFWVPIIAVVLWIGAILVSAAAAGFALWVGDRVTLTHNLFMCVNISGLSYWEYCEGAVVLILILYMLVPTGPSNNNKNKKED